MQPITGAERRCFATAQISLLLLLDPSCGAGIALLPCNIPAGCVGAQGIYCMARGPKCMGNCSWQRHCQHRGWATSGCEGLVER